MRERPLPLCFPGDYSPRSNADRFNQLLKLQTDVRWTPYDDRCYELGAIEAHMAAFCRIVRGHDLEASTVESRLRATLNGEANLWTELAHCFDHARMPDEKLRRKAAEIACAVVYGSGEGDLFHEVLEHYSELTGTRGLDYEHFTWLAELDGLDVKTLERRA